MNQLVKYIKGDKAIWLLVILLAILSTLVVYSSIVTLAYKQQDGNTLYYLARHSFFLIMGFGLMYLTHLIRYTWFSGISRIALFITLILLPATLIFGANINQASRWLVIPVINQSFQTSDLAKIALIMYIARVLSKKQDVIKSFSGAFVPVILPVLGVCALILPANFSTAAVLFIVCMILMFLGRINFKYIMAMIGIGIAGIGIVILIAKVSPDIFPRFETWTARLDNYSQNKESGNYQVEQSKIAIATGGLTGKKPGNSTQRNFLPHPYSDFIYAIIVEEYGLIGGFIVIMLYLILLYRCIRIAVNCERSFGTLLVMGISIMLVLQAMINMAVAVNLVPVTGQPLPMVSMGGTSIWFTCIAIGIILSVSRGLELRTKGNKISPANA